MDPDDKKPTGESGYSEDATVELTERITPVADATVVTPALSTHMPAEDRRSVLATVQSLNSVSPGTGEKYEVLGPLGQGGIGEVLRVRDRDLKREIAMKRLRAGSPEDGSGPSQDALIRFIEEAQATGQLEHPNIVPVHDIGVDREGRIYFTLKYVQGETLAQVIKSRKSGTYSAMRQIEILISICQAVAYAHSKGIIHRDLKPANVMLGKFGEVVVMDWGLAKLLRRSDPNPAVAQTTVRITTTRAEDGSQATIDGAIAGTPAYMAPEQAAGKINKLDERTDVYALGAILYEILCGEAPYRGSDAMDVVNKVLDGPPLPIRNKKGAFGFVPIPRELAAICARAMARVPGSRYPGAGAMRDDLQAYLENRPVSAVRDGWLQRTGKWIKRNRRQVKSGFLSAAVVLGIVFASWFGYQAWRVRQLVDDGEQLFENARNEFKYKSPPLLVSASDPYAGPMNRSIWAQKAGAYRNRIQQAMEPLRRAIDLAPKNAHARTLMAEASMELWRLAVFENNDELAKVSRRDVESFSPDPAFYAAELDGFGSFIAGFDSPDADTFLFRFEMLNLPSKDGMPLPSRLIPVPYDTKQHRSDGAFLAQETARLAAGRPVPVDRHSIFNLEPTPASHVGHGSKTVIPQLAPGNYMLLVRAPGRIDVRISFKMERLGKVHQDYLLPKTEDNPPGFFYMAGGDVIVGGETAGAPAPHTIKVAPAWIYHDEMSMADYGLFLQWLFKNRKAAEAKQRLPKDFGRNIATLGPGGELIPAEGGVESAAFNQSPVRGISFNDAQAYVEWRSAQDGLPYRLPKDWEWEAACRGADGRKYSWGDTAGKGLAVVTQGYGDSGNHMSWKWEDYKDESPWGIHNLAGGVAEWTMSLYDPEAKPEDPVFGQYAIRGNAWALPPVGLDCAFRTSGQPDYFHPTIGFRIALDHPYTRTGPAQAAPADPHAGHPH